MAKVFLFNPYTGTPRHPSDIASDPEGLAIVDDTEPLRAALAATPAEPTVKDSLTPDAILQAARDGGTLGNIESPFNACMHRDHCEGWKRAALAATPAPAEPIAALIRRVRSTTAMGGQTGPYAYGGENFGRYLREATEACDQALKMLAELAATPAPAPHMLQGEDPRIEPVRSVVERLCGTRQSAENFARRILAAADSATPAPAPQWVPVSERMPDDPQDCVFYSPDLRNPVPMLMGLYIRGKFKCAGHEMVNVTHWMPIPAAPEGQGKEASNAD